MHYKLALLLIGLFTFLGFAAIALPQLSGSKKLILILFTYVVLFVVAMVAKLTWQEVGLSYDTLKRGIIFALPFVVVIVIVGLLAYFIKPDLFLDSRYQLDRQSLLIKLFVILPLFTVLVEEIAFRGVLFGMLQSITAQNYATLFSSFGFGLWHIFTAQGVNLDAISPNFAIPKIIIVLAIIVATSVAGIFLTWLRIKSGSLIAPILVHWSINGLGIMLAYFAWQQQ